MMIHLVFAFTLLLPLFVFGLSFTKMRKGWLWLFLAVGTFTAWVLTFFWTNQIPLEISLIAWEPIDLFPESPTLLVDEFSWPFAFSVITIGLATLLTDVLNYKKLNISFWAICILLSGLTLFAVLSANLVTLLLAWALTDLIEFFILIQLFKSSQVREEFVFELSFRIAAMVVLFVALVVSPTQNLTFIDHNLPPGSSLLVLVAAVLRLATTPIRNRILFGTDFERGLGSELILFPVASSLMVFARVALGGVATTWLGLFPALIFLILFIAAWRWFKGETVLSGRSNLVFSAVIFVLASSVCGLPSVSIAWGLAFLLSSAHIFFFSASHPAFLIFPLVGVFVLSALPLSPSWNGVALFVALPWYYRILVIISQAFILAGYLKFARSKKMETEEIERWMWLVYSLGLSILLISNFLVVIYFWKTTFFEFSFQISGWWYGIFPSGLAIILLLLNHRGSFLAPSGASTLMQNLDIRFFSGLFWRLYRYFARFFNFLSTLLEGEGGILWALLVLLLIVISLSLVEGISGFGF